MHPRSGTVSLARAELARRDELFLAERLAQVYEGDTALHAAGFSYDPEMAQDLITRGADIRARSRRGAEPLHAAAVEALLRAGADPRLPNDRGSTAFDLAQWTTGRGGTGSAAAKVEQRVIIDLLAHDTRNEVIGPPQGLDD